MSKQQMIEAIRAHNRSVTSDFLATFDERSLQTYLRRLTELQGKRGKSTVWVRPGDTTAVVTRMRHLIGRKRHSTAA